MKKQIRVNEQVVEMSLEEVIKKFKPMLVKETKKHTDNTVFNAIDKEDLMQEMSIATWEALETYDLSYGTQFSTHLYNHLRGRKTKVTQPLFAKKRTAVNGVFSLDDSDIDQVHGDRLSKKKASRDLTDHNADVEKIFYNESISQLIYENTTEMERDFIEIMILESQGKYGNKSEVAEKYGITRKTVARRVEKTKLKLQNLLFKNNYAMY